MEADHSQSLPPEDPKAGIIGAFVLCLSDTQQFQSRAFRVRTANDCH